MDLKLTFEFKGSYKSKKTLLKYQKVNKINNFTFELATFFEPLPFSHTTSPFPGHDNIFLF